MVKRIVKNNKFLFNLALEYKESKLNKQQVKLGAEELEILDELQKNGVVAIPNFFTEKECQEMIDIFENLDDKYAQRIKNDRRIFGIEKLSDMHKSLYFDNEMFKRIGESYVGDEIILQTTMAAKIVADEKAEFGSGGSWHRDSFSRQFKAVTYLDDVTIDNGPFMYIKGSHTLNSMKKVVNELKDHTPGDFRYTNEEIDRIQEILGEEITYFTAPKGTLVLADIRGLHTGMPIKAGHRYALFNYYIAKSHYQPNNKIEKLAQHD